MQELIERLRTSFFASPLTDEAAEALTTLEAKLAVAREALEDAQSALRGSGEFDVIAEIAQALKEIEQ